MKTDLKVTLTALLICDLCKKVEPHYYVAYNREGRDVKLYYRSVRCQTIRHWGLFSDIVIEPGSDGLAKREAIERWWPW